MTPEEYLKSSFVILSYNAPCHVIGEHSGRLLEFRFPHGYHNVAICEGHLRAAVKFLDGEKAHET